MTKGELTKQKIIQKTMPLFSKQGFAGTSLSDILSATGLQKGGIYGHFSGKDELALAVFDYAFTQAKKYFFDTLKGKSKSRARLVAIAEAFVKMVCDQTFSGGCHILNTAIDSDDTHPALLEKVKAGLEEWRKLIRDEAEMGVAKGELKPNLDTDALATLFISTLEGSVMLSKVYKSKFYLERAVKHLSDYVKGCTI